MIHTIKLTENLRVFPNGLNVVGGEARVAAYCLVHGQEWPSTYVARDLDYVRVATPEEADGNVGILWNEKSTEEGKHIDSMAISSLSDYFSQIDQHTNGVAILDNQYLKITDEALRCFLEKKTRLNLEHPRLRTVSFWEYLALRACIQTGWDVRYHKQYYRHKACKLHSSIAKQLDYSSLKQNWYWSTYCHKMEQIKTGKH
jgi:hypothetical protein